MTSGGVKDPVEPVNAIPVGAATAEPKPTSVPKLDSIPNPVKIAASFGTTTEPCPDVIGNPVKLAS